VVARGLISRRQASGVLESLYRNTPPVLVGCFLTMLGVFVADLKIPRPDVVDALYLVPMAIAAAVLRARWAIAIWLCATTMQLLASRFRVENIVTILSGTVSMTLVSVVIRSVAIKRDEANEPIHEREVQADSVEPGIDSLEDPLHPLTRRERQIVQLVAQGWSAKEIAGRLSIGRRTVETHISRAYTKLGVASRVELILKSKRAVPKQHYA